MSLHVFISSTSLDLGDYRQAAIDICNELKLVPIAMEFFSAMGAGATDGSKQKIDESDLYIGIFAHRYGYVESGYEKSVTEIEFDYAGEQGLDRLCFLVDPSYPWPPDAIDHEHYQSLKVFKDKINSSLIRDQFTTVDDFRVKLMKALVDWQQRHPHKFPTVEQEAVSIIETMAKPLPQPPILVGREKDMQHLKQRLGVPLDDFQRNPQTIVRGWPGVGKTTMVAALAHDPEVVGAFTDGILWASVGEDPDPHKELKGWAQALGADPTQKQTLEDLMDLVRALLRDKEALLIVDDVWEADAALPFRVGGPKCAMLATTRFADVAREIAVLPDDIYLLDRLSEESGMALLSQLTPTVSKQYPGECRQLVRDLEGLPLALRVAGRLLEHEASVGFDVRESFESLGNEAAILREKAPEDRFDPKTGTTPTIQLLLQQSTDRLNDETREHFAFLGAFAPKPATFDLTAMKVVWEVDDPKPTVRELVDRGLLEPIPATGRFWMHSILVMHATLMLDSM